MIAALAARLIAAGVSERFARPLAIAGLVLVAALLAWAAWSMWLGKHDAAVIAADRSATTIEALNVTLGADRAAGAAKGERDRAFDDEQSNLQEKADAAVANGASPLDAVFDGLR